VVYTGQDFSQSRELISLGEATADDSLPGIRRLTISVVRWGCMDGMKRLAKRVFIAQSS
jgi:hypothetical protein